MFIACFAHFNMRESIQWYQMHEINLEKRKTDIVILSWNRINRQTIFFNNWNKNLILQKTPLKERTKNVLFNILLKTYKTERIRLTIVVSYISTVNKMHNAIFLLLENLINKFFLQLCIVYFKIFNLKYDDVIIITQNFI